MTRRLARLIFLCGVYCFFCIFSGCSRERFVERVSQRLFLQGCPPASPVQLLHDFQAHELTQAEAGTLAKRLGERFLVLGDQAQIESALLQSLHYVEQQDPWDEVFSFPGLTLRFCDLSAVLEQLRVMLPCLKYRPEVLAEVFSWYRLSPDFLVTGYFVPDLPARRQQDAHFSYPLYKKPPELNAQERYHSRHEIDRQGVLRGRGLEIAWVQNELDAFFLHVQGSGKLSFPDGSKRQVLYAGKNNHAYTSLGRVMCEAGLIPPGEVSMQRIRNVLANKPELQSQFLDRNASYVFFREADDGPFGSMGRPLTPWLSTATDRTVLPFGALIFLAVQLPDRQGRLQDPFYGLLFPQDTGGAITGARLDIFFGSGAEAEHLAGYLDSLGALYLLAPKKMFCSGDSADSIRK